MQRRQVGTACAIFVVLLAGCAQTPSPTPAPPSGEFGGDDGPVETLTPPELEIADFTPVENDDGRLVVDVMVSNPSTTHVESTLLITTTVGGNETTVQSTFALSAGERANRSVALPVGYDDWRDSEGGIRFDWR